MMNRAYFGGASAALAAAFLWSLNFIVPFVIGGYSTFDFALLRFGVAGLIGLCLLAAEKDILRKLTLRDWLASAWLALIGYVGYFLTVTGAAYYAGPVIAPAFLGLVPVVVAVIGNLRQGSVRWRALAMPLVLVLTGLLLVNEAALSAKGLVSVRSLGIGIPLAMGAVALWVWFAIANEAALAARPGMTSSIWTSLTLVGGGVQMLALFPIGLALDLFEFPRLGLAWETAAPLYIWGISNAVFAMVGGVWAWNVAARNLPVALAAQLIVSETAFGVIGGLIVHHRWPTAPEAVGIVLLLAGVIVAIRIFYGERAAPSEVRAT